MCGICGIVRFDQKPVDDALVRRMMGTMRHRGPDDEGVFLDSGLVLGFVRLSIIDLTEAGHQPMISDDGRHVIILNGEIYNYIELRKELSALGHVFKSQTDTEVLLASYREWGMECLHRLNGMWAFAIYDKSIKKLFCARDRFGVKPFYFTVDSGRFIFGSEIQAILKALSSKPSPNYQSIYDFLVFNRTDQTEATFYENINKLQHGHALEIDLLNVEGQEKGVRIRKWYDLRSNLKEPFKTPEEFRDALSSAVSLRLRSDVPVGVCLSGGLDSSSIVSLLVRNLGKSDLHTFSAVYQKGQYGDESDFIDEYQPFLKNMHRVHPTAATFLEDIPAYVKAHGEPIPSTGVYAQYKVMELARKNVTVILDGQGADEQLAGYHYFFGFYFKELFTRLHLVRLAGEMAAYRRNHHDLLAFGAFGYAMLPARLKNKARLVEKGYVDEEFVRNYSRSNAISSNLYGSRSLHESLLDHFEFKLEHLLKWEDRNSMWFSLEARVPFLDYRLVERTLSLPPEKVIRDGMTKSILREAMKGILPERIRMRQDKVGFDTPHAEWFRIDFFKKSILSVLDSPQFAARHLIDPSKAKRMFEDHIRGKVDVAKEIWKWINLELWFREFIDS